MFTKILINFILLDLLLFKDITMNNKVDFIIRKYSTPDEKGWLRCRVLSFLDSAYFDDVYNAKDKYDNPAIELVAEYNGEIVGIIDIECEEKSNTVCSESMDLKKDHLSGMIWHLATHPDFRRMGIAKE